MIQMFGSDLTYEAESGKIRITVWRGYPRTTARDDLVALFYLINKLFRSFNVGFI